tara:strand:+ start:649 stop:1992 length:1344 start_codon:yes stop_codon:yes gene_type:complete
MNRHVLQIGYLFAGLFLLGSACGTSSSGQGTLDIESAVDSDSGVDTESAVDINAATDGPVDGGTMDTSAPLDSEAEDLGKDISAPPGDDGDVEDDGAVETVNTEDIGEADPGQPDIPIDEGPPLSELTVTITEPDPVEVSELGTEITFTAVVQDSQYLASSLEAVWASNIDGALNVQVPAEDGTVSFSTSSLSAGMHLITVTVLNPQGQTASDSLDQPICSWAQPTESFDTNIEGTGWKIYGDAFWDPGGWLDMTGNLTSKKGAIFNTVDIVTPGDVSISFKIMTGGGINSGADGFAMSVYELPSEEALDNVVNTAWAGGCMGYGVSNNCGDLTVTGFHVEFDTWHNANHNDPTTQNHIGVMLNGDPSTHYLSAAVPSLEDMQWHDVTIQVTGTTVVVTLDGNVIIDDSIEGLDFRGGYIGFSGSTGWASNYHRFDELQILQECIVP